MKRTIIALALYSGLSIASTHQAQAAGICTLNPACWVVKGLFRAGRVVGGRTATVVGAAIIAGAAFKVGQVAMQEFLKSGEYVDPPKPKWREALVDDFGQRKEDGESLIYFARCKDTNGNWYPAPRSWTKCPAGKNLDYGGRPLDLGNLDVSRV